MMHVKRSELIEQTIRSIRHYPVTALIGPRQCGKTTLGREIFQDIWGQVYFLGISASTNSSLTLLDFSWLYQKFYALKNLLDS